MALEQDISRLVEASNKLTSIVDGKISQIDQLLQDAESKFDTWREQRDILGDINKHGVFKSNIFQGHIYSTHDANYISSAGDLPIEDLGTTDNVYVHFKTPLNINKHSEMFWFNIRGYSYGSASIINETIAGYCYKTNLDLISMDNHGNMSPEAYKDSKGNVVLRIFLPNCYYTTISIDTMRVGNGRLFENGDLIAKLSLAKNINFN
ncbi:hypothetical protein H0A36_00490 [Endozoicomonas sp. SM1973]|uniref:Uncharacterized protein n=1 Tax=Spartinivicinus marinus TaxID=2994442 RepID=A0A853HZD5_9GAMM|nr:hypothetical protein [Spartinivicinus marinus]MCX4026628.1 hypothetical protein [Spartinivicinus marinus]NYZ64462.1 hypothetical protein [Spartinivicinus marinus]